jgi:hypothetical protein
LVTADEETSEAAQLAVVIVPVVLMFGLLGEGQQLVLTRNAELAVKEVL